jgi:hypothetical protein
MPMKPAAPDKTAPIRKPMAAGAEQQPGCDENHRANDGDGGVLAVEICLSAFADAPAISCMRALPWSAAMTDWIAQMA